MRAVFIGASALTVMTARTLLARGHEVVIIEKAKDAIEALSAELDCGYIHGDGGKPAILREADPANTDVLFCLTGSDQANIIASLVGRSLGYERVVTKIDDPELEHICIELQLDHTIIPARTIGRHLAEMFEGTDPLEISAMIKGDARVFSFVARESDQLLVSELSLPKDSQIVCVYRKEKLILPDATTNLHAGDEVVIITHRKNLQALRERWAGKND